MENTTKIIIAAGVVLGGALIATHLINKAVDDLTTPDKAQEFRFLKMVLAVYAAKHMLVHAETKRTAPDLALLQSVIESEIKLGLEQQTLKFAFPKIATRDGLIVLEGQQGATTRLTIGSNF